MTVSDQSLRQRIKPILARFGITSSGFLWHNLALRAYRHKLRTNAAFRRWSETQGSGRVTEHWAHETVEGAFETTHLASQLYELSEMLRRRVGTLGDAPVLDAGASDGLFLNQLGAERGVGVNILYACARKIRSEGFAACLGDIEALPFEDKTFEYVICSETLEHVPNPIHTLNELARVCRRCICLTIPWLPRTRINSRAVTWPAVETHIFEFSEADFAKVLSHARVRIVYKDRIQVFPEPRNPLVQWWLRLWMYPSFFPRLQYYELEPC